MNHHMNTLTEMLNDVGYQVAGRFFFPSVPGRAALMPLFPVTAHRQRGAEIKKAAVAVLLFAIVRVLAAVRCFGLAAQQKVKNYKTYFIQSSAQDSSHTISQRSTREQRIHPLE